MATESKFSFQSRNLSQYWDLLPNLGWPGSANWKMLSLFSKKCPGTTNSPPHPRPLFAGMRRSTPRSYLTACLTTMTLLSTSSAYSSSAQPLFGRPQKAYRQEDLNPDLESRHPRMSYDLGLGKNPPVNKKKRCTHVPTEGNVYKACRFLVEHQATRCIPSPQDSEESPSRCDHLKQEFKSSRNNSSTTRKQIRKGKAVKPKRVLEDVLIILQDKQHFLKERKPTMIKPDAHELDVNSVWVEMLLHHQLSL
jgi:hypothetical protein